jgi:WD40 repeat protein
MSTASPVIQAASFSPDGKTLLTGGLDGALALWDVATGRHLGRPILGPALLTVCVSPDGVRWATGDAHGLVTLRDAATRAEIAGWRAHPSGIMALDVSPDGRSVATGVRDPGGTTLRVFRIGEDGGRLTATEAFSDHRHITAVYALAFSPDSRLLAAGGWMNSGFSETLVYDLASARPLTSFAYEAARALAFSPDGTILASGDEFGKIGLWDLADGRRIRQADGHDGIVSVLRFSPAGDRLASGGAEGKLILWDAASGGRLLEYMCGGLVLDARFYGGEILVATAGPDPKAPPAILRRPAAGS